ncbi:hypothetical protein [Amycolatopsis palatopharyngis]|uniref:hypothetical protein n=1 Tax=Amycolatopsis palatopharyngis TaxID=187982 RepID=UPI0013BE8D92|nr:hypothetical protein [Amycolatopsis palatopharyngis]
MSADVATTMPIHLEDLNVGERVTVPAGRVGPVGIDGRVHGAMVAAAFARSAAATWEDIEGRWRYLAPVCDGDELTFEVTITSCRRTPDLSQGVVGRHVRVRNDGGALVQEGLTTSLVPVRTVLDDDSVRVGRAFGTRAWASALAERLDDDPAFTTETSTWDGAIGIRYGDREMQFRIYRGRTLEAVSRTLAGPTFVVEASEHDWIDLFTGPTNDFARRAMLDQFQVRGNAYEYLRLTAALVAFVDQARELARAGRIA